MCGILQCHVRVNPNSLFKVRIEAQSSVALNYRIVRFGLTFNLEDTTIEIAH